MDKLKLKEQIRNDAFKMSGSMGTDAIIMLGIELKNTPPNKAV